MTDDLRKVLLDIATPMLNPETFFHRFPTNQVRELCSGCYDAPVFDDDVLCDECSKLVIDLTKRLDIVVTVQQYAPEAERFAAYDRITFDGDPESAWCIYGRGATKQLAIKDLLVRLAA